MRRFDKKHNIEKANTLAEQRYLESKGINEISTGLAQRAFKAADDKGYEPEDSAVFRNYKNPELMDAIIKLGFKNPGASEGAVTFFAEVPQSFGGGKARVSVTPDKVEVVSGGKLLKIDYLTRAHEAKIAVDKIRQDFKGPQSSNT